MKLFTTISIYMLAVSLSFAQQTPAPKTEFAIELSNNLLEIKPGEQKNITVKLLRSRSYTKLKASMSVSSTLPEGVSISFEPTSGLMDTTEAHIQVTELAKPGQYTIIINGTINHKNKGVMLKLAVGDAAAVNAGL